MQARDPNYRRRFALMLMLALLAVGGSFWATQVMKRGNGPTLRGNGVIDYSAERFSFTQMEPSGQPGYQITGSQIQHYPADDSFSVERPHVENLNDQRPPMTLVADQGRVQNNNSLIILTGNVAAQRAATVSTQSMTLRSAQLQIYPNDDVLTSSEPVRLTLGASTLSGNRMYFNNVSRELRLDGAVRGQYLKPVPAQP